MSRLRPLLAALLLPLGGLAPAASADASDDIVITAQRSAWAEFVLEKPARPMGSPISLAGGGSYIAVVVEGIDTQRPSYLPREFAFGAILLRAVSPTPATVGGPWEMGPGRYRVTVLSDAAVHAVLELQGTGTGAQVRATRPVTVTARTTTGSTPLGKGAAEVRAPAAVPPGSQAFALAVVRGARLADVRLCAAAPKGSCPAPQVVPVAPPPPLPPWPVLPVVPGPGLDDDSPSRIWVQGARAPRDVVVSVDGVHAGTTAVALGSLAYRRR